MVPWKFVGVRSLTRLTFRADAGDQLAVGLEGLIKTCRADGCPVVGKLENLLRMHRAHATGDERELSNILDELRVRPCQGR